MTNRRKKVCSRCHKKGIFRDAQQKHCARCEHEIAHVEKREGNDGKFYWDE